MKTGIYTQIITGTFGARLVLVAKFRNELIDVLDRDRRFKLVFDGADARLYQVGLRPAQ